MKGGSAGRSDDAPDHLIIDPITFALYPTPSIHTVELRSDTFTKPCEGMRKAMYAADCGDAMYGEDKTVQRLEEAVAGLLGKEAGLFGASGASVE